MDIVWVRALDWAHQHEQVPVTHQFDAIVGEVVGFLVREDEQVLVLSHQHFHHGDDVRFTTIIPKVCIQHRSDLALEVTDEP